MNLSTIAMLYIGVPYIYGGNCILTGVDCGALVAECLRSIGQHGKADINAQMIFDKYIGVSKDGVIRKDSILLFGRDYTSISHIAIALDDNLMIEAGGGDKRTTNKEIAAQMNAYVRIRPISWRKDYLTAINL